ncbi:MAG: ABC transporter substrate-binding protein [Sphingopyxis sp.]|nr:ABC transporter substrate-binding protein [Sphingopyxis sp.]
MRGIVAAIIVGAVALPACAPLPPESGGSGERIVSIDYCADQMLLGMVERGRIAAVSRDVESDPDFSLKLAHGIDRVRPEVEAVLALRPTLVVRSYGGGPRFVEAMERAGMPVFTLPYAASLAEIDASLAEAGAALDAEGRATMLRRDLQRAVLEASQISAGGGAASALYVTPGDVTTVPGSLIADLLAAAGYASIEVRPGWHRLPLEQLTRTKPDIVIRAFFESPTHQQDRWSSAGHRALDEAVRDVPQVTVSGSELACGNWRAGHALRRMADARRAAL